MTYLVLSSTILFVSACQKEAPEQAAPSSTSAQAAQHAPADAVPGSHEDWCGEHQVPESMCTRCNPSLVAAFKATGDWCEAHGLPKSQCLTCDPTLKIERPPQKKGH
ncbi:MAG: hypothetical protein KIT72_04770 [Polyangiaceae bacterium]|nr:hypothetical protein [Polyangiaceae bacterium]